MLGKGIRRSCIHLPNIPLPRIRERLAAETMVERI